MKKTLPILLLLLVLSVGATAQKGHRIRIKIRNYPFPQLLMTAYYGDKVLLIDTADMSPEREFIFAGDSLLPQGIYMAVSPEKHKLFEYIVSDDQQFLLSSDTVDYIREMGVQGSEDNTLFYQFLQLSERLYRENQVNREKLKSLGENTTEYEKLSAQIDSANRVAVDFKLEIINKHPALLTGAIFNATRDVIIPDEVLASGDSLAPYRYMKAHYWDYLDLSDDRLLRTPILARKVDQYFRQMVPNHPDSVIRDIDRVIALSRPSREVTSWLLWHFMSIYQNPEYMGFDVVFIHLVDTYFSKEDVLNMTPSIKNSLEERAEQMRPLILGSPAPDLILIDTAGKYRSFRELSHDYIILFFWDYDCGICKKESKVLKELYAEKPFDLEIYGICVNSDLELWKQRLVENGFQWVNVNGTRSMTEDFHDLYDTHGTPVIFILDRDYRIIAKNIAADQIVPFLSSYSRK